MLPSIAERKVPGYHGAYLMRRDTGDGEVEFATIMHFDDLDAVKAFAEGEDYETAYVPQRAQEVLKRFDERSAHFEVLLKPEQTR